MQGDRAGRRLAWMVAALLWAGAAPADESLRRFYGYAYDAHTGAYAYTEVHAQRIVDGRWRSGRIDYYAPDGRRLGDKVLSFGDEPYVPRYRMAMRDGSGSAIEPGATGITVTRIDGGRRESTELAREAPTCADAGFHLFLRDHFAQLAAGQTVRFQLIAAPRLARFRFRARKLEQTRFDGQPAMVIRLEPDSLLRLLAGPVDMTYDLEQRELLQFRGPSNIVDPATGKPYEVRIVYPPQPPADAPLPLPPLAG